MIQTYTPCPPARRRIASAMTIVVAIVALAGCNILSGAGPYRFAIESGAQNEDGTANYKIIDLSAATIAAYARPASDGPGGRASPTPVPDIRLTPGDVINVTISDSALEGGLFAPLAAGGTPFKAVRVAADGSISLPYVGRVAVAGKSLPEVERLVRARLKGITFDPQVYVDQAGSLSDSVLVAGAVKSPGRFSALQGPLTLLDAVNMAGGPTYEPHLVNVTVRNGDAAKTYNYQEVLDGANVPLAPRSEVVLERARKQVVAMGAVTKPGLVDFPNPVPSLLDLLGVVGGLSERTADPRGVFVFRIDDSKSAANPEPEVFRLDMRDPSAIFVARQFLVRADDAIYVTNSPVYEWQKIVTPIMQSMLAGYYAQRF